MTVLEVANLAFGYGADQLFQGVTFSLEAGERAALVAPNGAGKSTLLRLCAREIAPDAGTVVVRREVRVAYARQSHELAPEGTVLDAFLAAFASVLAVRHALHDAQHAAASGTDAALAKLAKLTDEYHLAGGDELERRVTMIAQHLGFSDADLERPMQSLSGGERGRLHLGTALAQEPDLLLLDEPTNHLDLDTIAWLERHLAELSCAMLVVSHDRAFLDNVCTITMELGRRSFRSYPLRYSDYAVARAEDLARERELVERQQDFIAKTEDFIRKNIAGQKTKQAQSRRKMLDKMDTLDRPEDVWATAEKVAFRFAPAPRTGDIVLDATGLGAARGGRVLFSGVDLLLRRGERVGIIGPNGSGKSTLLKLLAGTGGPEDEGAVRRGTNLAQGYFDQHLGSLDPGKTAVDEIRSVRGDLNVDGARQYLARFRFYGDDTLRRVSGFSGGERSRLALAKLLLEPRNLLFLDEPTNHLDIPAAEILEEALAGFEGTVLLVSHDRRFLEGVTTRVILVRDGEVEIYPGGFRDYEDTLARRAAVTRESAKQAAKDAADAAPARGAKARARVSEPPARAPDPQPRGNGTASRASEPPSRRAEPVPATPTGTVSADPTPRSDGRARVVKRSGSTMGAASPGAPAAAPGAVATAGAAAGPMDADARRRSFEADKARARDLEKKKRRVKELEGEIAAGEAELVRRREELKEDPGGNWAKLAELAKQEQLLAKRVEATMAEWMSLTDELGGAT
jgi:ATP-binding cassette subfamily F protein 3